MTIIFTYDRENLLSKLLNEVEHPIVVDDGSNYDVSPFIDRCEYHRLPHGGKEMFWNTWNYALELCKQSNDTHFMFMPDDWQNFDFERIKWIKENFEGAWAFNFANMGMNRCWTPKLSQETEVKGYKCMKNGFVDCGFFCSRQALEAIDWKVDWVNPIRFENKYISSGVGENMSKAMLEAGVKMYKPIHSLCEKTEQAQDSKMNPEERKRNPRPML